MVSFRGLSNLAIRPRVRLVVTPRFGPRVLGAPVFRPKVRLVSRPRFRSIGGVFKPPIRTRSGISLRGWYHRQTGVLITPHPSTEGSRSAAARKAWVTRRH